MTTAPATRRTLLRSAAWAAPAIVVATAAPAYAVSSAPAPTLPGITGPCAPTGFRETGRTATQGTYRLHVECGTTTTILTVTIGEYPAEPLGNGWWVLRDHPNSRAVLPVTFTTADGTTWTGSVKFPPAA